MKRYRGTFLLMCALGLCGLAAAQAGEVAAATPSNSCATMEAGRITVRAAGRGTSHLSLCDGHALAGDAATASTGEPLALASGDFDGDGVPDLASGFRTAKGGIVRIHRGNVNALWPYGPALRNGPPPAFLPGARAFTVPQAPDFLVVGDFDADGHIDVIAAQRGSDAMYFLRGDGRGGLLAPRRIELGGTVTAMISGEINRKDGLADLVVGIKSAKGPRALVFESPMGAVNAQPEMFPLPHAATSLALGHFNGDPMIDLAVGAGDSITVIHGRDRKLSLSDAQRAAVAHAKVTSQVLQFNVKAITAGDFTGAGPSIAALDDEGKVHILEHAISPDSMMARLNEATSPKMQIGRPGPNGKPVAIGSRPTTAKMARAEALRQLAKESEDSPEWTERSTVSLPGGFSQSTPRLISGRVSGSLEDDIIAVDGGNNQVHVLGIGGKESRARVAEAMQSGVSRPAQMRIMASLEATSSPVAVLPMRLSQHGLNGLVLLHRGQVEPTVVAQATSNVFTVTNTSDSIISEGTSYTGPPGSLRAALFATESASGSSTIVFNIPKTDPNYNAKTGTFLIRPLSESVPGALNDFALNPINGTVTIDGYTQPGASPNTLATGDNAKILIQIDGSKATTPGGAGLVPFDDTGSVYRGLNFTGWTLGQISNNTESGAEGMEANGVADFIEGNFFGTDPTGKTAASNRIGIFADNGPGLGSTDPGNIIGGTTPQARNILSGNTLAGVLFLSTAIEAELQGNFVGTDITGTTALPNGSDGAGLNGPTVTIGGTLAGDANVISGNPTNVDINDITEGNAAKDSSVQGNFIGTDPTGKKSVSGGKYVGVSIIAGPTNMLIGGTTPAARNIISGNNYGVYIFDGAFNNTVQGNYIGTDITGTIAIGNTTDGFASGVDTDPLVMLGDLIPAADTNLGGAIAGAGNVISGNTKDGVNISGTNQGPTGQDTYQGSTVLGNFIGTDATGKLALPNKGNGVYLTAGATNNIIGGTAPGSGNLISNNKLNGVLVDPGTTSGPGTGNNTIGNTIWSNGGAGVRVVSGSSNRISENSIFSNGALGIDIDAVGPNTNSTVCPPPTGGANNLQNFPVLTAGSGTAFISATATDPTGNTSEFSKAVKATVSGNMLSLIGNFNAAANTAYTIEFFSSPSADTSGFGEGETYLGSASVTTDGTCKSTISNPVNTADADMGVTLATQETNILIGPDYGANTYVGTVTNHGPATAHSVVFTDTLPTGLSVSSLYCNVGPCQTPVVSSLGTCSVSGQVITCNLGTMAAGATATVNIPVEASTAGSPVSTATVSATEADPNLPNNTANSTGTTVYPLPFADSISPTSILVNSKSFPLVVYGEDFVHQTAISFNGTTLPTTAVYDNQTCLDSGQQVICTGIQVQVPASLVTTAGTITVLASNPDPTYGGEANFPTEINFTIAPSCTFSEFDDLSFGGDLDAGGTDLIANSMSITASAQSCPWTAVSSVPWAVILDSHKVVTDFQDVFGVASADFADSGKGTGDASFDIAIAPNTSSAKRTGTITVAGQKITFVQDGDTTVCKYVFSPTSKSFTAVGGSGTIPVTSGCSGYFVQSYAPWITIPRSSGLLSDNGTASYTAAANPGAARTGTIAVGGSVFTVSQSAPSCYYTIGASDASMPVAGGTGSISVTPSAPSCAWTAKSSNTSLLSVTSGASGTGNGTVNYSVPANTEGPQTATITIGNATGYSIFTETQASAFTCTFTVSPATINVPANGSSNYVVVNASFGLCGWTATSNNPTLLSIKQNPTGSGTGAVYYNVAQNTSTSARVLTITVGCQTFTVNQDGVAANSAVPTITKLSPATVAAGAKAFTLTVTGTGFVSGATVNFNSAGVTTKFVSATQLTATIPATAVAAGGTVPVTVTNPPPGGGQSNSLNFTITGGSSNPAPTVTKLAPAAATAGGAAFTLTVTGTGFISSSVVNFNGTAETTHFVSATQVTASIPATAIAKVGSFPVTVKNPAPGGGTSAAVNLSVTAAGNPAPTVTKLAPAGATAGGAAFTLTITGTGFISSSVVDFNGTAEATHFVSATQITASIPATAIAKTGAFPVTVTNPAPGGGTSAPVHFSVNPANNPAPTVSKLAPASATAGGAAFTLTVTGTGFVSSSAVNFNGAAQATTFVSATEITAAIPASAITTAGGVPVTVTNPKPGGGASNSVNFTVAVPNNPVPTLTAVQPSGVKAGSAGFRLTVTGTGFISTSVVSFNGTAEATTFVSATQMTAAIPASAVTKTGSFPVIVTSPQPGGGISNAVNFTVSQANNPAPAITTIAPTSGIAGAAAFTLTVNGTGFIKSSVVSFNGNAEATTYVSATQVTASITTTDIASAGAVPVIVTNPTPGGGTSNSVTFIIDNPAPTLTSLQPQTVVAGASAFTLTVNGTGFNSSSEVKFNGVSKATTLVSSTQLTAPISAADIAVAGSIPVTVTNPAPGGGKTAPLPLAVSVATAPIASLSPGSLTFASTVAGAKTAAQVITLSNTGNAVLNISGITVTGSNPSEFTESDTCTPPLLAGKSCPISIVFNPDSAGSFSAMLSVADDASGSPQTASLSGNGLAAPSFTVSSTTGAQTVAPGGSAKYSISVAAKNGTFDGKVSFSVSGLPSGATGTFSPASVSPGSGSATSTLTIQTSSAATALALARNATWPLAASVFPLAGLFFAGGRRRRRWLTLGVLFFASFSAISALSGCGGGFALKKTSQTYNITVTGTSGAATQTTTVNLTVQ